jgi:hypothetical protein
MSDIARILVGDRFGRLVGELRPKVLSSAAWRFGIGQATLELAYGSPELSRDLVEFGNRIYVEFANGLPPWGGVFDPPRRWRRDGVTVTAYSGEHLFRWRVTGRELRFEAVSAGDIVRQLTSVANRVDDLGLRLGRIWNSGPAQTETYHIRSLWDIINRDIIMTKAAEVLTTPRISEGRILFDVHVYSTAGEQREVALVAGKNVDDDITLMEQGEIVNEWFLAGADTSVLLTGQGWGDTRLLSDTVDRASAGRFRLRQGGAVMPQFEQQSGLDEIAARKIADTAQPKSMWDLRVGNAPPATFDLYDLGDVVTLVAPGYGFDTSTHSVRLLSREFMAATGLCRLIVQAVNE